MFAFGTITLVYSLAFHNNTISHCFAVFYNRFIAPFFILQSHVWA